MKRLMISLGAAFISTTLLAQNSKCDCEVVFDDLIEKLEENYIGLAQLRALNQDQEYEKRKDAFEQKADEASSSNCTKVLQEFLSYFQDGHLFTFESPKYSESEAKQIELDLKENVISTESILATLEFEKDMVEKNGLDGIIGRWTDGKSEFAIIKDEGFYKAYIINSKIETVTPGELKAIFKSSAKGFDGTYYSYDYVPRFVEGNLYKEKTLLVLTGAMYWGKIGNISNRELAIINREAINLPTIQKLDDKNTLFSIPSFLADYNEFIQILTDNIEVLTNTTNLIIDIRGNVGGNAIYFSFLDAYATQPLLGSQGLVLASDETLSYFERLAKNSPEVYQPIVDRIRNNPAKIIDGPAYPDKVFKPFESNIQHVAILTDEGVMSAGESFILHSKGASDLVTTFGSSTGGVIDYTSINTLKLSSGDQNIYFGYPTSTFHKDIPEKGYNKTGIEPDVRIRDKVKDKIQFIMDYYESK